MPGRDRLDQNGGRTRCLDPETDRGFMGVAETRTTNQVRFKAISTVYISPAQANSYNVLFPLPKDSGEVLVCAWRAAGKKFTTSGLTKRFNENFRLARG